MRIDQFISGEAVDRLGDVLLLVGLDGSILDANRAALDCYGYSRADMLGLSIHDIRAPQDREIVHGQLREAADRGVVFEAVDRRSDGTLFPVEVKSASASVGGETALLSIVRDITERKQAERELRESESRYRALADGSPLAVFVNRNDPDNDDVILVNPACVGLFGASCAEDLIGRSALDLFDPDSRPLIRERIREATGAAPFSRARVVRLDGTLVEVEAVASPLLDQGLSAVQVVLRDITESNRSELELQATALYSRSLIEASLDPLVTIDHDGVIADVNRATEEATGVLRDALIGTNFTSYFTDPDRAREGYETVLREGAVRDYPLSLKRSSGDVIDVEYNATTYRNEEGEVQGVFAAIHDVTGSKSAHAQLAQLAAIVTSSEDAIFSKDCDEIVASWNVGAEALYGYSASEMIGASADVLMPPGRENEARQLTERVLQGDRISGFETQRRRRDGSLVDVALTLSPIPDDAGGIVAISVIQRDITERKRNEREVRQSEEKFATAFNASPDLLSITRVSDGMILEVNGGYERQLGFSRAESVGKTTTALSIWADLADRAEFITALEEHGEIADFETTLLRKDGTPVAVVESARAFELQGETCVLSVVHDITARKQAEEDMAFKNVILSTQQETSMDGILVVDEAARITSYNRRFTEMWHVPRVLVEAGIDEPVLQFVAEQLADQEGFIRRVRYLYEHRQETSQDELALADGRIFDRYSAPMLGPSERYYGRVWYFQDITERKRAEEVIRKDEADLREAQRIGEFGSFDWDARTDVIVWSDECCRIFGFEPGQQPLSYEEHLKSYSPESIARLDAAVKASMETGEPYLLDLEQVRPDGTSRWITARGEIKLDAAGEIVGVRGTAQDITARKQAEEELARQRNRVESALSSVIDIASNIVEAGDPYTAGHQRRVSELAARIAQDMGMPDRDVDDIRVAGLLHDVGKVTVPAQILSKPGLLSPSEFSVIRDHSLAGYRIITSAHMAEPIPELIYQHHERCDGSGYPRGLLADQILKGAKVLAVADTVEAMMSHRPYRPALGIEMALAEIERGAGTLYDAEVSRACVALFRDGRFVLSP